MSGSRQELASSFVFLISAKIENHRADIIENMTKKSFNQNYLLSTKDSSDVHRQFRLGPAFRKSDQLFCGKLLVVQQSTRKPH